MKKLRPSIKTAVGSGFLIVVLFALPVAGDAHRGDPISSLVEREKPSAASGVYTSEAAIARAVREKTAGKEPGIFCPVSKAVLPPNAVDLDGRLPAQDRRLAAIPVSGWAQTSPYFALISFAGLLLTGSIGFAARRKQQRRLRRRAETDNASQKMRPARKTMARKEKFPADILNSAQDGVYVLDRDLTVVMVNELMERQYAHNLPLVGKKCYQAFMQRDAICPWCPCITALNTGKRQNVELEASFFDSRAGMSGWIELSAYPLKENGEVTGVIEYVRDITKRKSAEVKLQQNYGQLQDILNSIDANVYVADMDSYEILFMNQRMIQDFGRDLTGARCWEALRNEDRPCADCTNGQLVDSQGRPAGSCRWETTLPGTDRRFLLHDRAIRWRDGRIVRLQIGTDISAIKHLEEELRQKHKMEAVGYMAGGMAHNFNNHLAVILGNLELALIRQPADSEMNPLLENAKTAVLRSRDLVNKIVTYSRHSVQEKTPALLANIIEDTVSLLHATLPSSINLQLFIDPTSRPCTILADPGQLQEVLVNLCNNAAWAMNEQGDISIRLNTTALTRADIPERYDVEPGRFARLSVHDNGTGIPGDMLDNIFDPFFTTKQKHEGAGMGLATAQGIVAQHGGLITVDSMIDKETVFHVYLPLHDNVPAPEAAPETQTLRAGNETILLIDDDQMLAQIIKELLSEIGYTVSVMTDSRDALKLFQANAEHIDLVITDQTMPGITGQELVPQLKQQRPDIPVILCTGYSNLIDEKSAKKQGINAFLMKPLDMNKLSQTVRQVLDEGRAAMS